MDLDLPTEPETKPSKQEMSFIQRAIALTAGGLGIFSLTLPFISLELDASIPTTLLELFGLDDMSVGESTDLVFGEAVGLFSLGGEPMGLLIMFLVIGGITLTLVGALLTTSLVVAGGAGMVSGSIMSYVSLSSSSTNLLVTEISLSTEPELGLIVLGISGLLAVLSPRL